MGANPCQRDRYAHFYGAKEKFARQIDRSLNGWSDENAEENEIDSLKECTERR
jgi:hypothetical protein